MSGDSLIAFNLVLMAALASPGAALLYMVKTALSAGRPAAIATGFGLGFAAALWTAAALLGLESLFALFPWAYTLLKTAGALYLIWIAVQTWRHARAPLREAPTRNGRAFLSGFLVNAGNPKSMLFAAAVILVVFPQNLSAPEIAFIVANHMILEWVFYASLAFVLSNARARVRYLGAKTILDRLAATLLGALGLRLLLER